MKVVTGRVVHGKVELDSPLEEGTPVAILAAGDAGFSLTSEEENELAEALAAIGRGDYEDGHALLDELKGHRRR
ncbi:MAG TPA: hypothetical protein VKL19_03125 [Thermoanaerobaculia bacterium]|nr:hypothetical protein [Thermoanaerobaculia bacterium]